MEWLNKLKWILIIGVVFTLVLATNLIDRRNFRNINDSVVSIYEDRLVIKNTILDMATAINQKEVAFLTQDITVIRAHNEVLTDALKSDLLKFNRTSVTYKEEKCLDQLKKNLELMFEVENELLQNQFASMDNYKTIIAQVNKDMDVLAHIQMKEGKKQFLSSQRNMATVELFTQLEIYFLILLAAIALIVIFRKTQA